MKKGMIFMKINAKFKSFTDGLAIFLAVLIAVYLMTGFIQIGSKNSSGSSGKLSFTEKIEKMLDNAAYRGYFHIFILLILSASVGIILRRLPWLSVIAAMLPLLYELDLLTSKLLNKYPTGVILLTASHLAGAIAYAAYCDRNRLTRLCCPLAGVATGLCGFGFAAYISVLAERVAASADTLATLREGSVIVPNAVRPIPGAVGRIYAVFLSEGASEARALSSEYLQSIGKTGVRVNFFGSVDGAEAGVYAGLCLVFLGAAVAAFVLAGWRLYRLSFAASCLPAAVCAIRLINEKLSAGGVILLAIAAVCAVCFAAPLAASPEEPQEDEPEISDEGADDESPDENTDAEDDIPDCGENI